MSKRRTVWVDRSLVESLEPDPDERCECCGGDGVLNPDLDPPVPIFTTVMFRGQPNFADPNGLIYFLKRVCTDCNNRWQRMLLADIEAHKPSPTPRTEGGPE